MKVKSIEIEEGLYPEDVQDCFRGYLLYFEGKPADRVLGELWKSPSGENNESTDA